jgi:hypothetical protein
MSAETFLFYVLILRLILRREIKRTFLVPSKQTVIFINKGNGCSTESNAFPVTPMLLPYPHNSATDLLPRSVCLMIKENGGAAMQKGRVVGTATGSKKAAEPQQLNAWNISDRGKTYQFSNGCGRCMSS